MFDVLVVGSLNMDLVVKTARLPRPGETLSGGNLQFIAGGKGGNQAVAAAKLGSKVAMVGSVGMDDFGHELKRGLSDCGVDVEYVISVEGSVTGTAIITVDESGENTIVVSPGANGRVSRADIDRACDLFKAAKFLLLQFEIPEDAIEYAIELAVRNDLQVILNPAPAVLATMRLAKLADFLVANKNEAELLTGSEIRDIASVKQAAMTIHDMGVPVVILTLGKDGALFVTGHETTHVPTRAVDVVDTTAAGDAFVGALASALAKGYELIDAVRYANCAGSLATTHFGAQPSLPTAAEVQAFLESEGGLRDL